MILGYWNVRGTADPIRCLLHYAEAPFEDKLYTYPEENGAWFADDKFNLGLDFPNLPYLFDGGVKLTQSTAILRYLARKSGLVGRTQQEATRLDLAEQQIKDFYKSVFDVSFSPQFESLKDDFVRKVPAQLKQFSDFLGGGEFFVGDRITYVDFMAFDAFDFYGLLLPDVLADFENLRGFQARMGGLPAVQKYRKSEVFKRWPTYLSDQWPNICLSGDKEDPPESGI